MKWRNALFLAFSVAGAAGCGARTTGAELPVAPQDEVWLTQAEVDAAKLKMQVAGSQDVGDKLETSGKVAFDDLRVSHIFSPVTGKIVKILAQPGQRVKKGAALAVIQSPDVGSAIADVAKAQADLVQTEHDFKRQKDLYEKNAASQKDFETAQDVYGKAKAELERALAKARLLRSGAVDAQSQEYTLIAPIEGEVIGRNANPGAEIQGQWSAGATAVELFTIGELDQVWVFADLYEADLAKVKQKQSVTVKVAAYPLKIFEGVVDWVSGSLDKDTRTAKVKCVIKNPDRELRPEMYAQVSISVDEERALAIPKAALHHLGDQTVVFVQKGKTPSGQLRFIRRPVAAIQDQGGDFLPVTHGLEAGEILVISDPNAALAAADAVDTPSGPHAPEGEVQLSEQQVKEAKIQVVPLGEQDVGTGIDASGKVTFDDLRVAHIFSPVTGRVTRILAQPGQRVKKGAALLTIQSPTVGQAASDLAKAQADVVAAEHDFRRQKALYEQDAASQKDYETAQDNYGKAKAELERALAKARMLRGGGVDNVTQEYTLKAPIDGEVIERKINPGAEVQGQWDGAATPIELFTIGELDQVWVVADLYEMDMAKIKKGAKVRVSVSAYPDTRFQGTVEWVSGTLDPATRTAKVRCVFDNADRRLRPEMYAKASIAIDEDRALAIPRSALLHLGPETIVFVSSGKGPNGLDKFARRSVTVAENRQSDFLPVLSGLERGEGVVTSGAILLSGML
jgi:cobalt-zinc-cadmium efflux system membrane fusion protein